MICLRCLFIVIYFLQVSTQNVLTTSSLTDDAQNALNRLYSEIYSTAKSITVDIPNTWETSINSTKEVVLQDLADDFGNFTALANNITAFANVSGGQECIDGILNYMEAVSLREDEGSSNIFIDIFNNLLSLANVETEKATKQFKELDEEFTTNCVEDNINCDGVSKYIIAEVERLVLVLKRIKIEFLAEVQVLSYKFVVDWGSTRALLMFGMDSLIKNATTCLASRIEDNIEEISASTVVSPNSVRDSVIDSYNDLITITGEAFLSSLGKLELYLTNLKKQGNNDYLYTIANIRGSIFKANQTINILHNIAPEFNITLSCAIPDLKIVLNSSVTRATEEYTILGTDTISLWYREGLSVLNGTLNEVVAIGLQVEECKEETNCAYLTKKIAKKSTDIPKKISSLGDSTSVLMHQMVISVRESGSRIIRDILEELEVGITGLKSCIRSSLY